MGFSNAIDGSGGQFRLFKQRLGDLNSKSYKKLTFYQNLHYKVVYYILLYLHSITKTPTV